MKEAIRIIKSEHASIAAVLAALQELTRMSNNGGARPDFRAFRAIVRYVDEYPEQYHHPKEERYLLEPLKKRAREGAEMARKIEAEHREGARLVRELERALVIFEDRWPEGWGDFSRAVEAFCAFEFAHMAAEERELLPLAQRCLTEEDWSEADAGFAAHADPIVDLRERGFRALFTRLVALAPAPVGLGEPWRATG
jgi:hemerythrin-like domain-containing protein